MRLEIVAIFVALFAIAEAALPNRDTLQKQAEKTPVTLDEVLRGTFSAQGFGGSFVPSSDDKLRVISGNNIWEYNVATQANQTIVESGNFTEKFENQALGLTISADNKYILVEHSRRSLWRHSYLAKYDIFDIQTGSFTPLQPQSETEQPELQLVIWSPTGNSLAFIFKNNIYYRKTSAVNEVVVQITTDGNDAFFNGISDWVYEEEMFGSPIAMWFSKDSSNLAFVKFNDTEVQFFRWPVYGEPGVRESVYPEYENLRYPKAGTTNPLVSLNIVKLDNPSSYTPVVYHEDQDESLQYYIATVTWSTNDHFIVQNLNRHQNQSVWNLCNAQDAKCSEVFSYNQPNGWIDSRVPLIAEDGSKFLTLLPAPQPNSNLSYTHIMSISTSGDGNPTRLTQGFLHVDSIIGWDEENDKIYFLGSGLHPQVSNISDPSERHVYYVGAAGTDSVPSCFTCDLKTEANEECRSHGVSFSAKFSFYLHSCRGPGAPEITTKQTNDNSVVKSWVDNADLRERLSTKAIPSTKDLEFDLPGGFKAKVRLYLPPNFNQNAKYPLLVEVYAGPDSQKNTQEYKVDWGTYLTSSKGIIYASIDGRGSARQSTDLKFTVNRNLGSVEIEDQIQVTKKLLETETYIDADKTAIWGWSFGGYATAMALGKDSEKIFKCGISVAPVTSWLYYDTIYTERYMGLPSDEDNWVNYNHSSVMNNIGGFRDHQFLLIHGNADDNVHYQQSMMLARALEKSDILFNQLSYPDENHGINGPNMRRHLYHSIEHFLERDCFGNMTPPTTDGSSLGAHSSVYSIIMSLSVILTLSKIF